METTKKADKGTRYKLKELIGEIECLEHKCYDNNNGEDFYEAIILSQHWLMDALEIVERDAAYEQLIGEMEVHDGTE